MLSPASNWRAPPAPLPLPPPCKLVVPLDRTDTSPPAEVPWAAEISTEPDTPVLPAPLRRTTLPPVAPAPPERAKDPPDALALVEVPAVMDASPPSAVSLAPTEMARPPARPPDDEPVVRDNEPESPLVASPLRTEREPLDDEALDAEASTTPPLITEPTPLMTLSLPPDVDPVPAAIATPPPE